MIKNRQDICTKKGALHPCPHFGLCPGCSHAFSEDPEELKEANNFFSQLGIDLLFVRGNAEKWRVRAKLAVRPEGIGLFKKNSHEVLPIPHCLVHHPSINRVVALIEKSFVAYDESSHKGLLRYIQCSVEGKSEKVALALVVNLTEEDPQKRELIKKCLDLYTQTSLLHSVSLNFNYEKSNRIFGNTWEHIIGPEYIYEDLLGYQFPLAPSHFMQANMEMYEIALRDICELVPKNTTLLELYGGAGIIGLLASEHSKKAYISDIEPTSLLSFEVAKKQLPETIQERVNYTIGEAEHVFALYPDAETLLVDPPRKGLSEHLLDMIQQSSIHQIIYLSCSFQSLRRNISYLNGAGWKTSFARAYDFFPGSDHVEILCVLQR